jgi:hypothetical protein
LTKHQNQARSSSTAVEFSVQGNDSEPTEVSFDEPFALHPYEVSTIGAGPPGFAMLLPTDVLTRVKKIHWEICSLEDELLDIYTRRRSRLGNALSSNFVSDVFKSRIGR